ncbi:MAG: esterase [Burkholderiaceae bacterium]|nr:esterase [Burkholderiaceae bacterium]
MTEPAMTSLTTLVVPGYHGSGKGHWQSWIEQRLQHCQRVQQDWEHPILAYWAQNIRCAIDEAPGPVWLIAHSFGCLATVAAASDRPQKIAGLMLVAPASPERFTPGGAMLEGESKQVENVRDLLPAARLPFPSLMIASTNDPFMPHAGAQALAIQWGSDFVTLENAGHINIASGFGPWPEGLEMFRQFQRSQNPDELALRGQNDHPSTLAMRGRGSYVARIRHITRRHFGY